MRTSIFTLLLALLSITTRTAEAGGRNPFSRFSPKWDAPMFKKAKPSYDRDISKTDLELTHMVNLLRMDPVLFCNTVLIPRAVKTGKRRQTEVFLMRCRRAGRLDPLEITVYHRYTAKRLLDSLRRDGEGLCAGGGQPLDDSASARFAWRRTVSGKPLDILMELILDTHACSIAAAEALLDQGLTGGILVRRKGETGFETGLVVDAMTMTMAKNANRPSICDDITMEERRILEFTEDTTDAIMGLVRRRYEESMEEHARLVDDKELKCIIDSLEGNRVSYRTMDFYFENEFDEKEFGLFQRDPAAYPGFPGGPRSWSGAIGSWDHPEKSLYSYSIGRREKPCSGFFEVVYRFVEAVAPSFTYHPDSVGYINAGSEDFRFLDLMVELVKSDDAETLAAELASLDERGIQKVRAVFIWLHMNVKLEDEVPATERRDDRVEQVLKTRKSDASGMSLAFKRLCELAGFRCRMVSGFSKGSFDVNHHWNMVEIDGKWHLVDVAWGQRYFLMDPAMFVMEHLPKDPSLTLLPYHVKRFEWGDAYEQFRNQGESHKNQ